MTGLPSGIVTFLFTDIEGSTRPLHELGEDHGEALAEHRRLLREAFTAHGGVEVETQGDALFVYQREACEQLLPLGDEEFECRRAQDRLLSLDQAPEYVHTDA